MLNIGTKVVCVKTFQYSEKKMFVNTNIYTITAQDLNNSKSDHYYIIDYKFGFYMYASKNSTYDFDNYFITLKEYRKLKLKKIYMKK